MKHSICSRNFSLNLRMRMVRCCLFSIVLYGTEAWTVLKDQLCRNTEVLIKMVKERSETLSILGMCHPEKYDNLNLTWKAKKSGEKKNILVEELKTMVWKVICGIISNGCKQNLHRQYPNQHDKRRSVTGHNTARRRRKVSINMENMRKMLLCDLNSLFPKLRALRFVCWLYPLHPYLILRFMKWRNACLEICLFTPQSARSKHMLLPSPYLGIIWCNAVCYAAHDMYKVIGLTSQMLVDWNTVCIKPVADCGDTETL